MTRIARVAIPEVVYHITQRGNNRQDVFFVDDDRRVYLELLADESDRHALTVLGYCLMTNHIHLVAVPHTKHSLAKAIGRTHWRYTRYVNRLHRRSGHLWQNRFFSCGLDEKHTVAAMRYVEQNPVRAKIVRKPWRYAWSSAAAHVGEKDGSAVLDVETWRKDWDWSPRRWRRMLEEGLDEDMVGRLRRQTFRGRPLGSDGFMSKLERRLGRRLRPLPIGRPRKKKR